MRIYIYLLKILTASHRSPSGWAEGLRARSSELGGHHVTCHHTLQIAQSSYLHSLQHVRCLSNTTSRWQLIKPTVSEHPRLSVFPLFRFSGLPLHAAIECSPNFRSPMQEKSIQKLWRQSTLERYRLTNFLERFHLGQSTDKHPTNILRTSYHTFVELSG